MWFMTDRLTESTEDAKLRALRASERLLAHIAGGRKTAAAFSERRTFFDAVGSDRRPVAGFTAG